MHLFPKKKGLKSMRNFKKKAALAAMSVFVFTLFLSAIGLAAPTAEKIRILCYGDSNTWGWMPQENGVPTDRYPSSVRWTGILQAKLGDGYTVIEEGLNARTAGADDFANGLEGAIAAELNLNGTPTFLPILKSQSPIDVVVIMLGTNDVRPYLKQDARSIAASVNHLVKLTKGSMQTIYERPAPAPKVLVIAPVPICEGKAEIFNEMFKGGPAISAELGKTYAEVAKANQVEFLDAGALVPVADGADGIHLSPEAHKKIAEAVWSKIKVMTQP